MPATGRFFQRAGGVTGTGCKRRWPVALGRLPLLTLFGNGSANGLHRTDLVSAGVRPRAVSAPRHRRRDSLPTSALGRTTQRKGDVVGAGVNGVGHAGRGTVALAVVLGTRPGPPFEHLARDVDPGRLPHRRPPPGSPPRVDRRPTAGGLPSACRSGGPIRRPLPGVANHVQAAHTHWAGSCRQEQSVRSHRGSGSARGTPPASSWPASCPSGPVHFPRHTARPPAPPTRAYSHSASVGISFPAHAGVGDHILPGHVQHRVPLPTMQRAPGSLRVPPVGTRQPVPPGVVTGHRHPARWLAKHHRASHQHLRLGPRVDGRDRAHVRPA